LRDVQAGIGWLTGKTATQPLSRRVRHGRKIAMSAFESATRRTNRVSTQTRMTPRAATVRFLRATIVEWCAQGGGSFSLFSRAD